MGRGGWLAVAVAVLAAGVAAWSHWQTEDVRGELETARLRIAALEGDAERARIRAEGTRDGRQDDLAWLREELDDLERYVARVKRSERSALETKLDLEEVVRWSVDAHGGSEVVADWTARSIHLVPVWRGGRPQGIRLVAMRAGHPAKRLGFREGDVLVEVNGVRLLAGRTGDEEVVPFWNRVGRDPDFRVEVLRRRGRALMPVDIEFTRDDVRAAFRGVAEGEGKR